MTSPGIIWVSPKSSDKCLSRRQKRRYTERRAGEGKAWNSAPRRQGLLEHPPPQAGGQVGKMPLLSPWRWAGLPTRPFLTSGLSN